MDISLVVLSKKSDNMPFPKLLFIFKVEHKLRKIYLLEIEYMSEVVFGRYFVVERIGHEPTCVLPGLACGSSELLENCTDSWRHCQLHLLYNNFFSNTTTTEPETFYRWAKLQQNNSVHEPCCRVYTIVKNVWMNWFITFASWKCAICFS